MRRTITALAVFVLLMAPASALAAWVLWMSAVPYGRSEAWEPRDFAGSPATPFQPQVTPRKVRCRSYRRPDAVDISRARSPAPPVLTHVISAKGNRVAGVEAM
jgi:hypothetical protein